MGLKNPEKKMLGIKPTTFRLKGELHATQKNLRVEEYVICLNKLLTRILIPTKKRQNGTY